MAVGGRFGSIYDSHLNPTSAPHTAVWDPAGDLRPLGSSGSRGLDKQADQIVLWRRPRQSPVIAALGSFYSAGGAPAYRMALWDGSGWSTIAGSESFTPTAISVGALSDPAPELLLIGSYFGGVWWHDGEALTELRPQSMAPSQVLDLVVFDRDGAGPAPREVYIAHLAPGVVIERFDAGLSRWERVSGLSAHDVYDMEVFDADGAGPEEPHLLVAGYFSGAAVMAWDGDTWSSMGGERDMFKRLVVVPGDAGLPQLFGVGDEGVWRWSGSAWARMGPEFGHGAISDRVETLAAWPTEPGRVALFAGGSRIIDGVNLARFDGTRWLPAAPYRDAPGGSLAINALLSVPCGDEFPAGLYAAGEFTRMGEQSAMFVARGVFSDECLADCDGSGDLTFFDFLCFQNLFAAGDPRADCDGDTQFTFFDFLCFQNAFAAGCP